MLCFVLFFTVLLYPKERGKNLFPQRRNEEKNISEAANYFIGLTIRPKVENSTCFVSSFLHRCALDVQMLLELNVTARGITGADFAELDWP